MDNSNGLTYVITRLIVLTNVLILCMLINSKLVIYIIILILSYLFGLPQLKCTVARHWFSKVFHLLPLLNHHKLSITKQQT